MILIKVRLIEYRKTLTSRIVAPENNTILVRNKNTGKVSRAITLPSTEAIIAHLINKKGTSQKRDYHTLPLVTIAAITQSRQSCR